MQGRHALIVERYFTADQHVEYDTETPDINFGSCIHPGIQQLGRGEIERSTKRREVIVRRVQVAQPEIDDFDISRLGYQDVFDLEI